MSPPLEECRYRDSHPAIDARLEELERRMGVIEAAVANIDRTVAGLRGWIVGAIAASTAVVELAKFLLHGRL